MKRSALALSLLVAAIALMLFTSNLSAPVYAIPPLQATATPGGIQIEPVQPTATPNRPGIKTPPPGGGSIRGTPAAPPKIDPPDTLDDLLARFPDLKPYLDKVKDLGVNELDLAELYARIVQIFEARGASGVAVFLKDSGLLEKLNLPLSYLDLLTVFDTGGLDAVLDLARERQIINAADELVGLLAIDSPDNVETVRAALTALGVSVYGFDLNYEELEIGIPLDLLATYQTPGTLLDFLVKVANTEHVVGFRAPTPRIPTGLPLQGDTRQSIGAQTIGADLWHKAGITGKGIRIGVVDLGFGGVKDLLGSALPEQVKTNIDIDEMNEQEENHGTAVASVIHGIAPDAELFLAWIDPSSDTAFIEVLEWLAEQKVQIVNQSASSIIGPRDGSSAEAQNVEEFMRRSGALWVNSAGNYAGNHSMFDFEGNDEGVHQFGDDLDLLPFMPFAPITTIGMNWNGSWQGSEKTEYIFTVYDSAGDEVAQAAEPRRGRKNHFPFQITSFETEPGEMYYIRFQRTRGETNNTIDIIIPNAVLTEWAMVPEYSVTTPGDAVSALTVGAVGLTNDEYEFYSSQGPTQDERIKPDVSAPTNEPVPGFEEDGFSGTSGAAPAAAGAAALVLQAYPNLSNAELKAYLMSNVKDLGDEGPDTLFGAGRVALPPPEGVDPERPNPGKREPSGGEATATITDVSTKFNVRVKGQRGLAIYVSLELDNYTGNLLVVGATFSDRDGNPLPSSDEDYSVNGVLATAIGFRVKAKQTAFEDVPLFIPNSAFADVPEDVEEMLITVVVLDFTDENNPKRLALGEPIQVRLRR